MPRQRTRLVYRSHTVAWELLLVLGAFILLLFALLALPLSGEKGGGALPGVFVVAVGLFAYSLAHMIWRPKRVVDLELKEVRAEPGVRFWRPVTRVPLEEVEAVTVDQRLAVVLWTKGEHDILLRNYGSERKARKAQRELARLLDRPIVDLTLQEPVHEKPEEVYQPLLERLRATAREPTDLDRVLLAKPEGYPLDYRRTADGMTFLFPRRRVSGAYVARLAGLALFLATVIWIDLFVLAGELGTWRGAMDEAADVVVLVGFFLWCHWFGQVLIRALSITRTRAILTDRLLGLPIFRRSERLDRLTEIAVERDARFSLRSPRRTLRFDPKLPVEQAPWLKELIETAIAVHALPRSGG